MQANWSAALQTLEGYFGYVSSVAFSPDGKAVNPLFVPEDWIAEGVTNILWLPYDYRLPTCVPVWNGRLVLGYSLGRISILEFKEGLKAYIANTWSRGDNAQIQPTWKSSAVGGTTDLLLDVNVEFQQKLLKWTAELRGRGGVEVRE